MALCRPCVCVCVYACGRCSHGLHVALTAVAKYWRSKLALLQQMSDRVAGVEWCLCSVSAVTFFVGMSAGSSLVCILMSLTTSWRISCCTTWCLSSLCFAFLDDPMRVANVATLLPAEESVWIVMLVFLVLVSSMSRCPRCSASVVPVLMAHRFAPALGKCKCCLSLTVVADCRSK